MGKRQRASWDQEGLTLIEDALNDIGVNEDCAKFLIESIGPSIGPRMILNAATKIIAAGGPIKSRDPSFERYLNEAHIEWNRNKYYAQTSINGESYAGITVIRKHLRRFSRDKLLRVGLSIPLPKARRLDDWVRRNAGIKSKTVNGARLYPENEIISYVEERSSVPSPKAEVPKKVPTSTAAMSLHAEATQASADTVPQQLLLPDALAVMLLPDALAVSSPRIVTLQEAAASAAGSASEDDDDAVIRRAAQSKHRKLAAAVQVAEVEERMAYDAYAKASNAHRAADKALTDFETQMAEYLSR